MPVSTQSAMMMKGKMRRMSFGRRRVPLGRIPHPPSI
jgi:hypothetical protein